MGEVRVAATAVTLLTRLPLARFANADPSAMSAATRWFPAVGLLIGALLALTLLAADAAAPASLAVVATIVMGVLLTGGLHEDGLADVADSTGAFGVERKLAVMRDSRIGTYGALALLLLVLARFVALSALVPAGTALVLAALVAAHLLARWSNVGLMAALPYARPEGAGGLVPHDVHRREVVVASLAGAVCLVPAMVMAPLLTVLAVGLAVLATVAAGWWFKRSFGGITGDCLGASNVLVEMVILTAATGFVA
ncbi:adenosylcobinamide-GDP ribazoletransferase [soil metagenome]